MLIRVLPILILLSVQILNTPSTFAQLRSSVEPAEIRGQLRYAQGGAPAAEVVIRLDQLTGGFVAEVRTDRLGKFRFSNLAPIQYQLIVRHPGYQEILREVNLIMTGSEYLQLQLQPNEPVAPKTKSPVGVVDANIPLAARKEFERGEMLLATGKQDKAEEAIRNFERAIALYPEFVEARLRLGTTYMDLKQWPKAETVLLEAREKDPRTPNVLFALGELYLQQHKTAEAEKFLREGLGIEPRSWQGRFSLGRLYWGKNDIVNAGRQVALALQLNPNFGEAHLLAGNIFLRARKISDAEFEFGEYLRLEPKGKYASQTREVLQKIKQARNSGKN